MARDQSARRLDTGDAFPRLAIQQLDGSTIQLPEDLAGHWSVLLFYRGHW